MNPTMPLLPPPVDPSLLGPDLASAQTATPVGAGDPSLDLLDGSRTVEVTALFGDSVIGVRHLQSGARGRISRLTLGLGAAGWALFAAGAISTVAGQFGFGTLLLLLGLGLGVYAQTRVRAERRSPHYCLGEAPDADLHLVDASLPATSFPLVQARDDGHHLNFTLGMQGAVFLGPDRVDLAALVAQGQARPNGHPGSFTFPLPRDAQARITVGENTFLIRSVAPARPVPGSMLERVDWSAPSYSGISLTVHATLLLLVFFVPPDARALSLDLFNVDNVAVTTRITPVVLPREAIPAWLERRTAQPKDTLEAAAAHKGPTGKMGSKESKQVNKRFAVKGPKDVHEVYLAREQAKNLARESGVLGLLAAPKGGAIASIFGRDSALGRDAEDALGNLIGNEVGDAAGLPWGLGPIGTEPGGGGLGHFVGTGRRLDTVGRGGPNGDPRYGVPTRALTDRQAKAPERAGVVVLKAGLDKEIIRRIVRRHINEVRYCYQSELQANPDLYGRVVVQFTIIGTGQVVSARVEESTLKNSTVETCIAQAVRRWLFPKPEGSGTVIVSYPFVLRAAGAE